MIGNSTLSLSFRSFCKMSVNFRSFCKISVSFQTWMLVLELQSHARVEPGSFCWEQTNQRTKWTPATWMLVKRQRNEFFVLGWDFHRKYKWIWILIFLFHFSFQFQTSVKRIHISARMFSFLGHSWFNFWFLSWFTPDKKACN
jgi:hypothetical protein